jgi:HEAT repeat protein
VSGIGVDYHLIERVLADPTVAAENWDHPHWRVRYGAAIGLGESGDARWLDTLRAMMAIEEARDLYGQPQVLEFVGSFDDTRAAEQLVSTRAVWAVAPTPQQHDSWQCRGRVRQACILAVHAIGSADDAWRALLHAVLHDADEDFVVKTAAAKALARVGTRDSIEHLEFALTLDEWCLNIEARKALEQLGAPR